jgi:Galactose oxidase, central domain
MRFILLLLVSSAALAQFPGTFATTNDMTRPRDRHTATLLPDGTVLIVGGATIVGPSALSSAELYDPRTGTFTATGNMTTPRAGHTATLLPDGKVLIAGGGDNGVPLASAELYDPGTRTFTQTGDMTTGRSGHAATLLSSGKVLIVGHYVGVYTMGKATDSTPVSAELYDPSSGTFASAGNMAGPGGGATLLAGGKVLITPDHFDVRPIQSEIYDPSTGSFSSTMNQSACCESTATLLMNGSVLVAYGVRGPSAIAELYDPASGIFSAAGNTATAYVTGHSATLLSDGNLLLAGGNWGEVTPEIIFSAGAEIYDPAKGTFGSTGSMHANRWSHTATLLNDGRVLIAGGNSFVGNIAPDGHSYSDGKSYMLSSAELYTPAVLTGAPILLSLSGNGRGQGSVLHAGTHQVVSSNNPASAGEALEIYLTGLIDGSVIPPQLAIGGRMAEILFFGKASGFENLNQVNVRVPRGVAPGPAVSLRLTYLGRHSNEVTIAVQ